MPIIDTHAHINEIEDWPAALERAKVAQVSDVIAVSMDLDSMRQILDLSKSTKDIRIHPALGVHPEKTRNGVPGKDVFDFMRTHIKEAIAIGETGLDFSYKWTKDNQEEKDKQRSSFTYHLEIAKEFDLPIVIHSRGAERDCLDMALQTGVTRALFHWYSGPVDVLKAILEAGYYVSTSPSVGYSPYSQTSMLAAPLERILIETDSPVTFRGEQGHYKSEPKDVWQTLKALSRLKDVEEAKLLEIVNQNAKNFFRI
jgi:TatD DNase family protein